MEYIDVAQAAKMPGLRLVLSAGVPGPWGEGAKAIFSLRQVPYVPVAQHVLQANEKIVEWTGHRNAPTAMYEDEPAKIRWFEILALAERLGTGASLIPDDPHLRVEAMGICHELCGEDGFGWNRRIAMVGRGLNREGLSDQQRASSLAFGRQYGFREDIVERADQRTADVMRMLTERLGRQADAGSPYLVGARLSAADVYSAAFAALIEPMPADRCPMPAGLRQNYTMKDPELLSVMDGKLLAHRDFVYESHIGLPMDF